MCLRETSESKPLMTCRKRIDDVETGEMSLLRDEFGWPLPRRMKLSINMSMTARGTSCANGTKCKDVAQTSSPETMSTGSWRCGVFGASADGRRRGPYDEASRKAGCGKSARPV